MKELKLMEHQLNALNLTANLNRVAFYHDMGLGKTFTGSEKMMRIGAEVNLIVCQKSKIDDWCDHLNDYYDNIIVLNLTNRKALQCFMQWSDIQLGKTLIGVVNYETAFRRPELLNLMNFTLMLDESSLISNENAKRSRFILKMHPDNVILLSGTPTAGKYEKLWSQCRLLGWDISKQAFWKSYVETKWIDVGCFRQEVVTGYKNVGHLKKQLAKHGALFLKTEEVMTLPEQIEQNIFVKATPAYKYFMKNNYIDLDLKNCIPFHDDSDFYGKDVTPHIELIGDNSLTKILHARQLCGQYHKAKLDAFRDLLESTEDRVLVFYNFTAELDQLRKIVNDLNRPHGAVNGQQRNTKPYEESENSITFIQYQAGAMGGNFQKANKIIFFSLPLGKGSCDLWEQSKKRIHRIGQNNTCFYYYLLVKDSIETWNLEALKEGKDFTDELFEKKSN